MHSAADVEVVTLEEQENEELSQALHQIQIEPGNSFDSFSEPTGRLPFETASAPTTARSLTAHALDGRPGTLGGENGASGASGKSALARDKQFSSSPSDEASRAIHSERRPCK